MLYWWTAMVELRNMQETAMTRFTIGEIALSFTVASLSNGKLLVTPKYRKGYGGVISRTVLAMRMAALLNHEAKK